MNGKRQEIPVTPPERELQSVYLVLASRENSEARQL